MRLYNVNESSSGGDFYQVINPSWDESTVTWNNAPNEESTLLASLGEVSSGNWYDINITSIVQGDGLVSVKIISTSSNGALYNSKEGTIIHIPQLVVSFEDTGANDPPIANGQSVITSQEVPITITLTGSDQDFDCPLTFSVVDQPDDGNLGSISNEQCSLGSGSTEVTYTPNLDFTGSDSFTFEIADPSNATSNTATVNINVNPSSNTLTFTPMNDAFVNEDSPTSNYGGANTLQIDGNPVIHSLLTFNVIGVGSSQIASATLRLYNSNSASIGGNFHQILNPSWDEDTVTWNNAPNEESTLLGSLGSVSPGNWYEVDITSIVTGNGLVGIKIISTHANGAYYHSKENSFDPELVVNLATNNNPPVADDQSVTTNEDTPITITLTASDPDGNCPLTFSVNQPSNGTLGPTNNQQCTSGNGSVEVTYTPDTNFSGSDSFTFDVNDGELSDTGTVSITVSSVNNPPVADDQSVTTDEDTPITITLTGSDPNGDCPLTFSVNQPSNGSLGSITNQQCTSGTGSADITYTPDTGYSGSDSFTFQIDDGEFSDTGTVSITVSSVNNPPVADDQSVTTNEDTPITITLTGSDPNGDCPLTFSVNQPSNGSLGSITNQQCTSGTGSADVTYTPDTGYSGSDSFTFQIDDGEFSDTGTVSITVSSVNNPPVADDQSVTTNEDIPITITLTGSDPNGDCPLTFSVNQPSNGSLGSVTNQQCTSGTGSADVTYTPDTGYTGSDSFTFDVSDGTLSDTGTVDISVNEASSLVFNPTDDAYIRLSLPDNNYGNNHTLIVDSNPVNHFLMRFDVRPLDTNQVISATLRIYNTNYSKKGGDFYKVISSTWSEDTITWNNAPTEGSNMIASLGIVNPGNWYEVDLTSLIIGDQDGLVSFKVISTTPDGAFYASKEHSGGFIPELVITLAP